MIGLNPSRNAAMSPHPTSLLIVLRPLRALAKEIEERLSINL